MGRWDRVNNQIVDVALALRAPAFAVWTERLNVQIPVIEAQQTKGQKFPVATGTVFLRGDLVSLQPWIVSNQKDSDFSVSGKAEGKFALESNDRMIALESELAIRNFSIQPAVRKDALVATRGSQSQIKPTSLDPIRQEQQLTLSGRLMYDRAEDRLQIERLTTGSRGLGVRDLAGTIEGVSQRPVVKLEGQLFYDLTQVTRLLNTYMDDQLVMVGQGIAADFLSRTAHDRSCSQFRVFRRLVERHPSRDWFFVGLFSVLWSPGWPGGISGGTRKRDCARNSP